MDKFRLCKSWMDVWSVFFSLAIARIGESKVLESLSIVLADLRWLDFFDGITGVINWI